MKNLNDIRHLVFKGGSVKGIAYLGAVYGLSASGLDWSKIEGVAGTSAGSILALLVALDYSADQMLEVLVLTPLAQFLDDSGFTTRDKVLASAQKHSIGESLSKLPAKSVAPILATRLLKGHGLYEGDALHDFFQQQLKQVTGEALLTFAEFASLCSERTDKHFRSLRVVAFNLSRGCDEVFSVETTPDVLIADALRCSISIPYVFKPYQYREKQGGTQTLTRHTDWFVDGGLTRNYPIDIFDDSSPANATLGLCLVSEEKLSYYLGEESDSQRSEIDSFVGFSRALIAGMHRHQERLFLQSSVDRARSIMISSEGISTLQFNLTHADQQTLVRSGWLGVCRYISTEDLAMPESLQTFLGLRDAVEDNTTHRRETMSRQSTDVACSAAATAGLSEARALSVQRWCCVNIWTSERNSTLHGDNVGHVSIQTHQSYYSLWPAPRAEEEAVRFRSVSDYDRFRLRHKANTIERRPSDFKADYKADYRAEGDRHANARIVLYSLDVNSMDQYFRDKLKPSVDKAGGWRMIGSNVMSRLADSPENCASLAYRLLKAGKLEELVGALQMSTIGSKNSIVVQPDVILKQILQAKHKELIKYPETQGWKHPDESDVHNLFSLFQLPAINSNEDDNVEILQSASFDSEAKGTCVMI